MSSSVGTLTERLVAIQAQQGLSDSVMAERIGIHRTLWNRVKRGKVGCGPRVVQGSLKAWPELALEVSDGRLQLRRGALAAS